MTNTYLNIPPEWKAKQRRASCPHCGTTLWTRDGSMPADHDRPDGRTCRKAAPFVDVSTVHEYGLTQKLSNSIRCF